MKCIQELVENMTEEFEDAEKYANLAMDYKDKDAKLSEMYHSLAKQELEHANLEHEQGVRLINEYKAKGNEPPEVMMAVWDWEHRKLMDQKARIVAKLGMVK